MIRTNQVAGLASIISLGLLLGLAGCATPGETETTVTMAKEADDEAFDYIIGPGDTLQIFVWRNPEVSLEEVTVRPDGKITSPLVEDLTASGRTPNDLARAIEKALETYIRQPIVTVIVNEVTGTYSQQIRVIGQAATPQSLPYRRGMSLLDVMIAVGGLTEFASGNRASLIRTVGDAQEKIPVRIEDLLEDGDITANVPVRPGDVLIIPESWL